MIIIFNIHVYPPSMILKKIPSSMKCLNPKKKKSILYSSSTNVQMWNNKI